MQATFLRFHNAVLDRETNEDFALAQQIVRWHYQWIVMHDFLPRIVGNTTYQKVVGGRGGTPELRVYEAKGRYAFIPVEFSVAAYRFGHSMVRPSYALNHIVRGPRPSDQPFGELTARFHRIPVFSVFDPPEELGNLNGFRELPDFWAVDWGFFFDGVTPDSPPDGAVLPQPSYRIDTALVDPLVSLPDHLKEQVPARRALATLNLLRGWRMGLPSGQAVAHHMGLDALSDQDLFDSAEPERKEARAALLAQHGEIFEDNCPLWFYILREAELLHEGEHLGPVGGTIVAEVLAGLIMEDGHSFLSQWPTWRPTLPGAESGHFTIADMINFTNSGAEAAVA